MKTALTLLFAILLQSTFSQTIISHPELDKFVGTWQYINGNTTFIIKLKKVSYYFRSDNTTEEILMGTHSYTENGILLDDNNSLFPNVGQNQKGSLFLYTRPYRNDLNEVHGGLKDLPKHTSATIRLNFMGGTPNQMTFEIESLPDVIMAPTQYGTTFPTGIITFTKQ